jgi:hypothetical protein
MARASAEPARLRVGRARLATRGCWSSMVSSARISASAAAGLPACGHANSVSQIGRLYFCATCTMNLRGRAAMWGRRRCPAARSRLPAG